MIFFDIDGTLLDYKASQGKAAFLFAKKYTSYIQSSEDFPGSWDQVTERHMARYLSGEISFQEQRRCRVRESLGLTLSSHEADIIFNEYYQIYEESWSLFPDVDSALKKLTDFPLPLAVITNGDKGHQTDKLRKLGILDYFTDVVTPACAGAAKPDVAIFNLAASRAGIPPNQCWYIGDQNARQAPYFSCGEG